MKKGKGSGRSNGLLPNSLRIISSCLKTVSANANTVASTVRSAGASVASSISVAPDDQKDQVLWAGFDKLELGPSVSKQVLLLGYSNGFQVLDVEDASNVRELVSKRDGPVTFLQMQPIPIKSGGHEGFTASHPLLLVVAGEETNNPVLAQGLDHSSGLTRDGNVESQKGNCLSSPTAVRFYSLRSHTYVHVLRFRSAVYMVRCSPRIVAVGLAAQIYCFDAVTLENKFSVLTYPVPQVGGQGTTGLNIGYGAMAVGPRWLAYASNNPLLSNMGRLSPQNLTPSPGVSPSTSPGNGNLVARYAMESSKQLAAGIISLGDMGYKTLSKYYQELSPDGSNSPVSSNSSWKVGGRLRSTAHSTETDNAGTVVIKDFVSRAVVSQFRAHTSPISALCFDPSGTLLVTASVYGNNINIFRIMPSCLQNESGTPSYDWSNSHVHLYKLYRGITTAVIQDIRFSHFSQWIAIISSRGTCHIYVLSPFGGEAGLQTRSSVGDGPTLIPCLTSPWWSTSSCTNQQSSPPPASVTLSVVSRIKNGSSGWLNTVSNAAASATGKGSVVPTGAVAVAFHNSLSGNLHSVPLKDNALEHLLVYTPSGHLVQHELLPSPGVESSDSDSGSGLGTLVQIQDEELRVKVQPAQWWHVCRRSNWPEKEEAISEVTPGRKEVADLIMDTSNCVDINKNYLVELNNSTRGKFFGKPHERAHWYLSNAEVQISSRVIPIWQKSEIFFHMMVPLREDERKLTKDYNTGGEVEIEKILVQNVEIKRKDLLPVFDHFHNIKSDRNDRVLFGGRNPSNSSYEPSRSHKFTEDTVFSYSKPTSVGSVEISDSGATESPVDFDQMKSTKSYLTMNPTTVLLNGDRGTTMLPSSVLKCSANSPLLEHSNKGEVGSCFMNGVSSLKNNSVCSRGHIIEGTSSNRSGQSDPVDLHDPLDFGQYFQEGYCEVSELDECHKPAEVVRDADSSSSHRERENPNEDEENDDILGGMFAFSEEG